MSLWDNRQRCLIIKCCYIVPKRNWPGGKVICPWRKHEEVEEEDIFSFLHCNLVFSVLFLIPSSVLHTLSSSAEHCPKSALIVCNAQGRLFIHINTLTWSKQMTCPFYQQSLSRTCIPLQQDFKKSELNCGQKLKRSYKCQPACYLITLCSLCW